MRLIPSSVSNRPVNSVITLTVQIANYGNKRIAGGTLAINFNTSQFEITDPAGKAVTKLFPKSPFDFAIVNKVDNNTGRIDFSAGAIPPGAGADGKAVDFVEISFRGKEKGTTILNFEPLPLVLLADIVVSGGQEFYGETFEEAACREGSTIGIQETVLGTISGRPFNPFKCLQSVTEDEKSLNCFNIIRSIIPGTTFAITAKIYTLTGRPVKTLFGGFVTSDGKNIQIQWDGTDMYGRVVLNGVYVYQATLHTITGDVRQKPKFIAVMK